MPDGRDDRQNYPPNRGAKLRYQGSNPTGDQDMSFKPYYSEEMDYTEGGMTHMNERTRAKEGNYSENLASSEECQNEGLNLKQPL